MRLNVVSAAKIRGDIHPTRTELPSGNPILVGEYLFHVHMKISAGKQLIKFNDLFNHLLLLFLDSAQ